MAIYISVMGWRLDLAHAYYDFFLFMCTISARLRSSQPSNCEEKEEIHCVHAPTSVLRLSLIYMYIFIRFIIWYMTSRVALMHRTRNVCYKIFLTAKGKFVWLRIVLWNICKCIWRGIYLMYLYVWMKYIYFWRFFEFVWFNNTHLYVECLGNIGEKNCNRLR